MGENKEQAKSATKMEPIDLGPYHHSVHFRDPRQDWEWVCIRADRYLPSEILYLYRGVNPKHVAYYKQMFSEWGVKFETFTRDDGRLIGYIKQSNRRWTILGELRSIINYFIRNHKMPAIKQQEEMWAIFETTEAPLEKPDDSE